jgi:hypothetical protein
MNAKIKQLDWKAGTYGNAEWQYADTPFGTFNAYEETDPYTGRQAWAIFRSIGGGHVALLAHRNTQKISTAKQRCQEYFERLVIDCLETQE